MSAPLPSLTTAVSTPPATEGVPFFAAFDLAREGTTGVAESVKHLAGLSLAHVVRQAGAPDRLFTYWASADHYQRARANVLLLAGATQAEHAGYVDTVVVPEVDWWKRVKPATLLLSAAALVGAGEIVANQFDHLFESPQLMIKPEKSRFDALEGTPWQTHVSIVNQLLKTEHRDVRLSAFLEGSDKKRTPLRILENDVPTLAVGATREISIEGVAPPAGDYTLLVDVAADAGWLRGRRTFPASAKIVVYPQKPHPTLALLESNASGARFGVAITLGNAAPLGLECDLEIQKVPGLRYDGQITSANLLPKNVSFDSVDAGAQSEAVLRWSTDPVALHVASLTFVLGGAAGTDWKAVAGSVPRCFNRLEKLDDKS